MKAATLEWRLPGRPYQRRYPLTENLVCEVVAHFCNPTVIFGQSGEQDDCTTPCATKSPWLAQRMAEIHVFFVIRPNQGIFDLGSVVRASAMSTGMKGVNAKVASSLLSS